MSHLSGNRISCRGKDLVKILTHSKFAYSLGDWEKPALFGSMFSNSLKRVYIYMHILNGQLKSHSKGYGSLGVNSKLFCPYLTSKQMAVSPSLGFPGGSDGKASACKCGRPGFDPWVGQMPWRRKWQLTAVLLPGKFHGWKSLVGYSPGIAKSRTWLSSFTGSSSSLKASAMHRLFGH